MDGLTVVVGEVERWMEVVVENGMVAEVEESVIATAVVGDQSVMAEEAGVNTGYKLATATSCVS